MPTRVRPDHREHQAHPRDAVRGGEPLGERALIAQRPHARDELHDHRGDAVLGHRAARWPCAGNSDGEKPWPTAPIARSTRRRTRAPRRAARARSSRITRRLTSDARTRCDQRSRARRPDRSSRCSSTSFDAAASARATCCGSPRVGPYLWRAVAIRVPSSASISVSVRPSRGRAPGSRAARRRSARCRSAARRRGRARLDARAREDQRHAQHLGLDAAMTAAIRVSVIGGDDDRVLCQIDVAERAGERVIRQLGGNAILVARAAVRVARRSTAPTSITTSSASPARRGTRLRETARPRRVAGVVERRHRSSRRARAPRPPRADVPSRRSSRARRRL